MCTFRARRPLDPINFPPHPIANFPPPNVADTDRNLGISPTGKTESTSDLVCGSARRRPPSPPPPPRGRFGGGGVQVIAGTCAVSGAGRFYGSDVLMRLPGCPYLSSLLPPAAPSYSPFSGRTTPALLIYERPTLFAGFIMRRIRASGEWRRPISGGCNKISKSTNWSSV